MVGSTTHHHFFFGKTTFFMNILSIWLLKPRKQEYVIAIYITDLFIGHTYKILNNGHDLRAVHEAVDLVSILSIDFN